MVKTLLKNCRNDKQKTYVKVSFYLWYLDTLSYVESENFTSPKADFLSLGKVPQKRIKEIADNFKNLDEIFGYLATKAPEVHVLNFLLDNPNKFEWFREYQPRDNELSEYDFEIVSMFRFCENMQINHIETEYMYKHIKEYVEEKYDFSYNLEVRNMKEEFCELIEFLSHKTNTKGQEVVKKVEIEILFNGNTFNSLCAYRERQLEELARIENDKKEKAAKRDEELKEDLEKELKKELEEELKREEKEKYTSHSVDFGISR